MKKLFTVFAAAAMSMSAMAATTFTFQDQAAESQTKDGFTVTLAKGTSNNAPVFNDNYGEFRLYANNTITVSGADISRISMTFSKQGSNPYATLSANVGTLTSGGESSKREDLKVDVWTGTAGSVTFTLGSSGQRIIQKIVINGDAGDDEIPTVPGNPDVPSILDPDYQYPEVAVVNVPSQTVKGDAYSFVDGNVQVSCTKGAVTADYFSAHAGFDMTFTATQPIKGIVIAGFVKKDFTATASAGTISYLTPSEDESADPVLVIKDADSKSITISCVKQLRCYSVEVYFAFNPDQTVGGGDQPAQEVSLTFDSADCVYEAEYSEEAGEPNYTIYLNMDDDYFNFFALDIYPGKEGDVTGVYSWDDWSLGDYTYYSWGEGDEDFTWAVDGQVTISKEGQIYTIKGSIPCENNKVYNISFTGEMQFYTDEEYYGGEDDGVESILDDSNILSKDAPMYDLMGRRVAKSYRGIYIQNGRKYIGK